MRISEDAMLHPFLQSSDNFRINTKIHISHPEGNDIHLRSLIPLHRVGSSASNHLIEIVFHRHKLLNVQIIIAVG